VHREAIGLEGDYEVLIRFREIHWGPGTRRQRMNGLLDYVEDVDRSREEHGFPPIQWPHWLKQVKRR
jgi:hypothetical protein